MATLQDKVTSLELVCQNQRKDIEALQREVKLLNVLLTAQSGRIDAVEREGYVRRQEFEPNYDPPRPWLI